LRLEIGNYTPYPSPLTPHPSSLFSPIVYLIAAGSAV
jgi:hypothetical protein